jgi:uncharacterized protein
VIHYIQRSIADLIFNRVFERFPRLSVVSAEKDIGWIAHYIGRMDHGYDRHRHWMGQGALQMRPSETFKEHVYATFMDDVAGMATRHLINVDRLMWASDYPHSDSTWPHTKKVAEEIMKDLTQEQVNKVCRGNAIKLLQLDFPA